MEVVPKMALLPFTENSNLKVFFLCVRVDTLAVEVWIYGMVDLLVLFALLWVTCLSSKILQLWPSL